MTVRFFFDLSISYLIPRNPHNRRDGITDASWEQGWTDEATSGLAEVLKSRGFEIAYRTHQLVDKEHRLYAVHFAVSAARVFDVQRASVRRKGRAQYAPRPSELARKKSQLEADLRGALQDRWVANAITYNYAAAWHFTFEVKIEGVVALRRVFAQDDIADAGGSVRDAIESFNSDVADSLEPLGFSAFPRSTARRPKDDIYRFDVLSVQYLCVPEDNVCGDLSLMTRNMSAKEFPYLEIKNAQDSFSGHVEDALTMLEYHDYPESADVVSATLELGEVDEEICEHVNFLAL